MNADHQFSLILYSRYYSKLPLAHAKTSKLDDITLNHMVIKSSFGRCMVPFDPPLKSFAEVRERVVAMHQEALKGLDVEDLLVDEYKFPNRWWMWLLMGLTTTTMITFPFRSQLHPDSGSFISQIWSLGGLVPQLAKLAYKLSPIVWPLTILIHLGEAAHMARGRLTRYQVEMFSGVWWMWVVDNFFEGVGAFFRFDEMVKGMREEKGKKAPQGRH